MRTSATGGPDRGSGARATERVLDGLGVAGGIAIGAAHILAADALSVPEHRVSLADIPAEVDHFADAVAKSRRQVHDLKQRAASLSPGPRDEVVDLLEAYLQMLTDSRLTRGVTRRIHEQHLNAAAAVQTEVAALTREFASLNDAYLAARGQEIREVGNRLLRNLTATPYKAVHRLPAGAIALAEELTPPDAALLEQGGAVAMAAVLGGPEGHTAILARALGLPAVLGVTGLLTDVSPEDPVIVDGDRGHVVVRPSPETLADYQRRLTARRAAQRRLARLRGLPAVTRDGHRVDLCANLELPREVAEARRFDVAGVGLLRSEFLYMNRTDLPSEEEQFTAFAEIVKGMNGRPVTIRTLDVGGDKRAISLADRLSGGANPALGLRAIRLSLEQPELLDAQLAAILRAGALGPVRILLPMVATPDEVMRVRKRLTRVTRRLRRRNVAIAEATPLGVMIEVPGAALAADALARVADFFAIGTNDLTMYTLAIDRADQRVAHLYNPLHPAVLRLVQFTTEAALLARIPVSLCGEIAGDPRYTGLLLGLGVRELSMSVGNLAPVKQRVRRLRLGDAQDHARQVMAEPDPARIVELVEAFDAAI